MMTRSAEFYDQGQRKRERTQEIIQDEVNGGNENNDTSGCVKQALGLEIPPGNVINTVGG